MTDIFTPGVVFDVAAFHVWRDTENGDGLTLADTDPYLAEAFDHINGDAGWLAVTTLDHVTDQAGVWQVADGITVQAYVLAGTEGDTDGVVVEVLHDKQWLACGRISPRELVPVDDDQRMPGYEAAICALEAIAAAVNARVDHYHGV